MNNRHTVSSQRGVALLVILIILTLMSLLAYSITNNYTTALVRNISDENQQRLQAIYDAQQQLILSDFNEIQKNLVKDNRYIFTENMTLPEGGEHITVHYSVTSAQNCLNEQELKKWLAAGDDIERQNRLSQIGQIFITDPDAAGLLEMLTQPAASQNIQSGSSDSRDFPWQGEQGHVTVFPDKAANKITVPADKESLQTLSGALCSFPSLTEKTDLNALSPNQATIVMTLLSPEINENDAKQIIHARPSGGWKDRNAFMNSVKTLAPHVQSSAGLFDALAGFDSRFYQIAIHLLSPEAELNVISDVYIDPQTKTPQIWQQHYEY